MPMLDQKNAMPVQKRNVSRFWRVLLTLVLVAAVAALTLPSFSGAN
jgi:hypothetical protein